MQRTNLMNFKQKNWFLRTHDEGHVLSYGWMAVMKNCPIFLKKQAVGPGHITREASWKLPAVADNIYWLTPVVHPQLAQALVPVLLRMGPHRSPQGIVWLLRALMDWKLFSSGKMILCLILHCASCFFYSFFQIIGNGNIEPYASIPRCPCISIHSASHVW